MPMSLTLADPPKNQPPQRTWDDESLLNGLLAGDRRAAGAMYDHLRPAIDATLRRILRQRGADFEDLVQVSFERILRGVADGRFQGRSSLKTWSCAIASHVALDARRRLQRERQRSAELPEEDLLHSGMKSDRKLESMSELRRVQNILTDMKPQLSEALIMYDVLGYKLSEIAELIGATESATQSRLHRARKEFRRRADSSIPRRKS